MWKVFLKLCFVCKVRWRKAIFESFNFKWLSCGVKTFHIAPIWPWGSQSAPRTHLAIAGAVCTAPATYQLNRSQFPALSSHFQLWFREPDYSIQAAEFFGGSGYKETALGSQSRGAGAENLAPLEPQLQSWIGSQRAEISAPIKLPNQLQSWKPNGSAMREKAYVSGFLENLFQVFTL